MKQLFLLLSLLVSVSVCAQNVAQSGRSCVKYVKEHVLYNDNGGVNVIDLDLEWPETVDNADIEPLQKYLNSLLFKASQADLDSALTTFKNSFGIPVTGQFATIPDDNKFCYVSCSLREIGYLAGRYISFDASYVCSPAAASSQQGDTISLMITYDLINSKVLLMKDVVNIRDISTGNVPDSFVNELLLNSSNTDFDEQLSISIQDVALGNSRAIFKGQYITYYYYEPFTSSVALNNMQSVLTRGVKKMLKADIPVHTSNEVRMDRTINGEPIYVVADSMPTFNSDKDSLGRYITKNFNYPNGNDEVGYGGNIIISFVVNKDGYLKDIRVISASTPEMNREVARVFMLMPRWTPGMINGKLINVRMSMPLSFVPQ